MRTHTFEIVIRVI